MNYYEYLFGDKQVMDKAPSRDAYMVLCNDVEGTIPRLINAIGKHGNGGHSYEIVLDPDTKEKESFFWDGDGSDRIDGVVKIEKEGDDKDGKIADDDRDLIVKELGDTLWYVASIARYLDVSLSEVAEGNIEKLESRYQRNRIHG